MSYTPPPANAVNFELRAFSPPAANDVDFELAPASGGITGTLAVTETGADILASTGSVRVAGALAVTEAGSDTFAAPGSVRVAGALAVTEAGSDTFAAPGSVRVAGALAVTEAGSDTFAAPGSVRVAGALAVTEAGSDTFAATGTVGVAPVVGTLAVTEAGSDTFAAPGSVRVAGALAATEVGSDSTTVSGAIRIAGLLAALEEGSDEFFGAPFYTLPPPLVIPESIQQLVGKQLRRVGTSYSRRRLFFDIPPSQSTDGRSRYGYSTPNSGLVVGSQNLPPLLGATVLAVYGGVPDSPTGPYKLIFETNPTGSKLEYTVFYIEQGVGGGTELVDVLLNRNIFRDSKTEDDFFAIQTARF
jgi:hypothetical protein